MSRHHRLTLSRFAGWGLFVLVVCGVLSLTRTVETQTGKPPTSQPLISDERGPSKGLMAIDSERPEPQSGWSLLNIEPQQSNQPHVNLPNFDVRLDQNSSSSDYLERVRSSVSSSAASDRSSNQAIGLARLKTELNGSDVIEGGALGTPEVVSARPGSGFLSGPTKNRPEMLRCFSPIF